MRRPLLICDLDGTLVDSQPGIAAALRQTCAAAGIAPLVEIDRSLIGPPLDEVLRRVTGLGAGDALDHLRNIFIEVYDGGACQLTVAFAGVEQMLQSVMARGFGLALATNKRHKPTALIIEALGWQNLFDIVEAVDSRTGSTRSKAWMLRDILDLSSPSVAAYLGDTAADVTAAREASLPCLLAGWGYGWLDPQPESTVVLRPEEVISAFIRVARPR